jgi:3-oxoacyl-[acyl-carrier-protein] synthase II
MTSKREVVITALGVVSPIGIGIEPFWDSLLAGRSGVRRMEQFADASHRAPIAGSVADFEPKKHVRLRKNLKVMSRDIQLGFSAADQAAAAAGVPAKPFDPERSGVVYGAGMIPLDLDELESTFRACIVNGAFQYPLWGDKAMKELYPLWMLKYLPNMSACHIGIALDFRGPNNTLVLGEVASLSALAEAVRVIQRGQADAMIAGGTSCHIQPISWIHEFSLEFSQRLDDPAHACRPFDRKRDGLVNGEGAAAYLLQDRELALARGDRPLARILGFAAAFEPRANGDRIQGHAIRRALEQVLRETGLRPADIGHVNAHGASTTWDDQIEARAIRDVLGDVPVTAPKSYFGNTGAAGGVLEMAVSVLGMQHGLIPPTLNYENPDPECPINVIHGQPLANSKPVCLALNHSRLGQAVVVALARDE